MNKLLKANMLRLRKDKVFILSCVLMAFIGMLLPTVHYFDNVKNDATWTIDSTCFIYAFLCPILLAIIIPLYVGCEYSDKTIRNKIISGHKRYKIYLSNLIICLICGLILCLIYLLFHTCFGIILLGGFESSFKIIISYLLASFAIIIAFTALYMVIAMLVTNKSYSIATSILLAFALLFLGIKITSALNEPEYYSGFTYTENTENESVDSIKNPNYLSGTKREIYEFFFDFILGGQIIQISNLKAKNTLLLVVYDCIILFSTTTLGIVFFSKKDLK